MKVLFFFLFLFYKTQDLVFQSFFTKGNLKKMGVVL